MNLLDRLKTRGNDAERGISTLEDYAQLYNQYLYSGLGYGFSSPTIVQTIAGGKAAELAPNNFTGLAEAGYLGNAVVFACMAVRQLIFSSIRFRWQRLRDGKPSDMFTDPQLRILEQPWPGGSTQDLLSRMIQDADIAGNSYWTLQNSELVRLRPDWVNIVVAERQLQDGRGQIGWELAGYTYTERGQQSGEKTVGLLPSEVVHFCPHPDPLSVYRGMSWLTPILREIAADHAMTRHERKFFENGATPNMVVKHAVGTDQEKLTKFAEVMGDKFAGAGNAYKTLHLYPGADVTVVGADMKQIDFTSIRNGGEARVAAAAGIPPVIAGLTPGLESSTYSNYAQARRRLADGTAHPLWQNLSGSLQPLFTVPRSARGDVRLWYDATDVPFLREDEADAANIAATKATTISSYITAGFTADSAVAAVESNDLTLLSHTNLFSVQLQPPGVKPPTAASNGDGGGMPMSAPMMSPQGAPNGNTPA